MNNKSIFDWETDAELRDQEGGDGIIYNSDQLTSKSRKTNPILWAPDAFWISTSRTSLQRLRYSGANGGLRVSNWWLFPLSAPGVSTVPLAASTKDEEGNTLITDIDDIRRFTLTPTLTRGDNELLDPTIDGRVETEHGYALRYQRVSSFNNSILIEPEVPEGAGYLRFGFAIPSQKLRIRRDDDGRTNGGETTTFTVYLQIRQGGPTSFSTDSGWVNLVFFAFPEFNWGGGTKRSVLANVGWSGEHIFTDLRRSSQYSLRLKLYYSGSTVADNRSGGNRDEPVIQDLNQALTDPEADRVRFSGPNIKLYFDPDGTTGRDDNNFNWSSFAEFGIDNLKPNRGFTRMAGNHNFLPKDDNRPRARDLRLQVKTTYSGITNDPDDHTRDRMDVFGLMRFLAGEVSDTLNGTKLIPSDSVIEGLRNRLNAAGINARFNGAIQERKYLFEVFKQILLGVRLQPYWLHGRLVFIAEDARLNENRFTPEAAYNSENIIKGSFRLTKEINKDGKAGNCSIKFYNDVIDKEDTAAIAVDDIGDVIYSNNLPSTAANKPVNFQQITLRGWADLNHNLNLARFKARLSKFWRETITFKTPYVGHAPLPGEVIEVKHYLMVTQVDDAVGAADEGSTDTELTTAINLSAPAGQPRTKWVVLSSNVDFNGQVLTIQARTFDRRAYE